MKIKELQEARHYSRGKYPLFFVICDPKWETRTRPGWPEWEAAGPFLFFDMGIDFSSGKHIGKRKTGSFDTPEKAQATLDKWNRYYTNKTAGRFKYADKRTVQFEEQILSVAKIGVVELNF